MSRIRRARWALVLAVMTSGAEAQAHGGEDHGAPAAPVAVLARAEHVASGETDKFSVVVKYPAKTARGPLAARIYVARAETSGPVAEAKIHLQLKGGVTLDQEAAKTDTPGVYEVSFPAPQDGAGADGTVSVEVKDEFDLVLVGDLHFGPPPPSAPSTSGAHREAPLWALIVGAGALAGLTGAVGFALGRRSKRSAPPGGGATAPAVPS